MVTEPSAIYYLVPIGSSCGDQGYKDPIRSFHPKAYIFEHEDDGEIYVGGSSDPFPRIHVNRWCGMELPFDPGVWLLKIMRLLSGSL